MNEGFRFAALVVAVIGMLATTAKADVPYDGRAGGTPSDLADHERWMYAATPERGNDLVNAQAMELHGVRGASLVDAAGVDTAWRTTTGRADVVIAVHDSGIEWDNLGAMRNLRRKAHLNLRELPTPRHDRPRSLEPGQDCKTYRRRNDANGDGVVNVVDFSCDRRVQRSGAVRLKRGKAKGNGIDELLDPQDVLIAFSDNRDDDRNGYRDDIVGWDFLDDDNDPYDDVQYGHGTGEALDSTAEAGDAQRGAGTCPNCQFMPIRVGDSFVADVNRFALGVRYATDNGASVVQEALGTLNNSRFAREAVDHAYRHGVTVIASAADEAAQHHHWPASYPGVVLVNSVTKYDDTFTPIPRSYLQFNGCTNFSSKLSVAIPSVSCSSDATGRASGMAGLLYSAARDRGIALTPNEVRQLMETTADDVDFAISEISCEPVPLPTCTDPQLSGVYNSLVVSPLVESRRYPARQGFDQFYGHGRVNMNAAVDQLAEGRVPPSVAITAPEWFAQIDPKQPRVAVRA
ncbi:MAG TPA: S8 family serine peptidase, partial [Solirubrobacteraceae bacterium]